MSCTCNVIWKEKRIFDGFDKSGRLVNLDASATYGGTDTAPSPMDLLLIGLCGCTGIVMTIAMEQFGVDLQSLEIHGAGERAAEEPGDYVSMDVQFEATGEGVSHETLRKAILEFVLPKAPVLCTLSRSCPVQVGYVLDGIAYAYFPERGEFSALQN